MKLVRPGLVPKVAALLVWAALAGCGRPGPAGPPPRPAALAAAYQAAEASRRAADWVKVARAELSLRDWPAAAEAYQQALQAEPHDEAALGELAGLRLAHRERRAAEALIAQLEQAHPESANAQVVLGGLYGLLGQRDLAVASYRKALRLAPGNAAALLEVGRHALRDGDLAEAERCLRRLKAAAPAAPSTRLLQLNVAQAAGRQGEVEQLLRDAHTSRPSPESRAMLASYYLSRGLPAKALAVDDAWLGSHPDDGSAILAKAEALRQLQRGDEALQLLRKASLKERPDPRITLDLAKMLLAARRTDEAETALREVLRLAPLDSGLRLRVAELYARYDQTREAAEILDQLQREDPRYTVEVRIRMADLAQQADLELESGDPIESSYLYALSRQPDNVRVMNNLAFHYAETERRLDAAQDLIERATALVEAAGEDPEQEPVLLDTRAWIAFRQKRYDAAWRDLERAWAQRPDDALLAWHRAAILDALGRRAEAKAMAQKALADRGKFIGRRDCERLLERLLSGGTGSS